MEDAGNPDVNDETEAVTSVAGGWQELTFDFADQVGANALDLAATHSRVVIFFDFGTEGIGRTYYADDVTFPAQA